MFGRIIAMPSLLSLAAASVFAQQIEVHVGWEGERPPYWSQWTVEERHEYEVRVDGVRVEFHQWVETYHAEHPGHPMPPGYAMELYDRSVNAGFAPQASMHLVQGVVQQDMHPDVAVHVVRNTAEGGYHVIEAEWREDPHAFSPVMMEEEHGSFGQWVSQQTHSGVHGPALAQAIHVQIESRKEARRRARAEWKAQKEHGQGHGQGHGHGKKDKHKD